MAILTAVKWTRRIHHARLLTWWIANWGIWMLNQLLRPGVHFTWPFWLYIACGMPALNTVSCYGCGGVPWWVSVCVCGLCKTACPLQCGQTSNLRRPRTQLTPRKECPSTSCPVLWAACMLKFSGVPQIVAREARPHSNAFLGEALDPNRTIACLLPTLTVVCFLVRGLGRELKSFLFVSLALPLLRQACIIWVLHCFLLNSFYSIEF